MKKLNEMQYLAGVINQDHYYDAGHDKNSIKKMTRRINRIIENINEALEDAKKSAESEESEKNADVSKEESSAVNFFRNLRSKIKEDEIARMSTAQLAQKGDEAKGKMAEFKRQFEEKYPEAAEKIKKEAESDAQLLKGELPTTTEGIMSMLAKGAAMVGKAALWAAWKVVKFILLQILKVVIKIAKNIFTVHGKGILPFVTICGAIIFPWLGFVQDPIFLIPAGIYYMVITIGALLKIGEHE
jgi:hypothetical protein